MCRIAAVLAAAGVLAGGALGVAMPLSPAPGASSLHPVFTWSLPSTERSQGLSIADRPDLAPDGRFLDEDVITSAEFANDERQWSPGPLYAGHYWWLVWSSDRSTSQSYYSAPAAFTVPVSLKLLPVKTVRSTFLHLLAVRVGWTANVHG